LTQFSISSVSGKGRLHVLRRWILDIHVHRGVSIIRRRHEGKTSVARFIIALVLHNFQLVFLPILQDERLSIMEVSGGYDISIIRVSCGYQS
jgi:hypothetical protein